MGRSVHFLSRRRPAPTARRHRAWLIAACAILAPALLGNVCEGDGSRSRSAVLRTNASPGCRALTGQYPSGFDLLPGNGDLAVVMEFNPPSLVTVDLETVPPRNVGPDVAPPFPSDSDGDGVDDALRYVELGLCSRPSCTPVPGEVIGLSDRLVALSTSTYDQVVFLETPSGETADVWVENPLRSAGYDPDAYPVLPAEGATELRTAVSTKTCVHPPGAKPVDSRGDAIPVETLCDPDVPGYFSSFTNAKAMAAGRLFVATSNAASSGGRYRPGTVLVYDFDRASEPPLLRPTRQRRLLFTTRFNPTGLTPHRNRQGRELVLVTNTGALSASGSVLTPGSIDVIDAANLRLVATIPLEYAGASFGPLAIDPRGRVALAGSDSKREFYAVDLIALDDESLYPEGPATPDEPNDPVVLDGSTPGWPDARIFSGDAPFRLPHRSDGPNEFDCATRINVALNAAGDLAYATDWCDGTLTVVEVDLAGVGTGPIERERFRVQRSLNVLDPKDPRTAGLNAAPSMARVRPGEPGVDYSGADVYFIGNEEAQLCGVAVEAR